MPKHYRLLLVLSYGLLAGLSQFSSTHNIYGEAISLPDPPQPHEGPAAFEQWIVKVRNQAYVVQQEPTVITDALLKCLKENTYVTDKAVMDGIGALGEYEGLLAQREPREKKNRYQKTIAMIDKVSTSLYGRPWLKAQLEARKAALCLNEGNNDEAISVRWIVNPEFETLYAQLSVDYIDNLTVLGELLAVQGKKKKAESVFLNVKSFPWYLATTPTLQKLRERYVRAGKGLIDCRRGKLNALQDTWFIPSSLDELGPYLNEALVEAGGEPRQLNVLDNGDGLIEVPLDNEREKADGK